MAARRVRSAAEQAAGAPVAAATPGTRPSGRAETAAAAVETSTRRMTRPARVMSVIVPTRYGPQEATHAQVRPSSPVTDHPALELLASETLGGSDLLEDQGWLRGAFARWGMPAAAVPSAPEIESLKRLRALLRRIAESVAAGRAPAVADVAALNADLARTPVCAQLEVLAPGRFVVDMRPLATHRRDLVVRELAGSFVALLRRSTPPRLKVCANPDCRRVFVDESRNRSRRWCSSTACGNRLRVRRHRESRRLSA